MLVQEVLSYERSVDSLMSSFSNLPDNLQSLDLKKSADSVKSRYSSVLKLAKVRSYSYCDFIMSNIHNVTLLVVSWHL